MRYGSLKGILERQISQSIGFEKIRGKLSDRDEDRVIMRARCMNKNRPIISEEENDIRGILWMPRYNSLMEYYADRAQFAAWPGSPRRGSVLVLTANPWNSFFI